jgi:hypothetical protein
VPKEASRERAFYEFMNFVVVSDRFAPLASVLIGIGLALFVLPTVSMVLFGGIAVGLMASGLYSGTRAIVFR